MDSQNVTGENDGSFDQYPALKQVDSEEDEDGLSDGTEFDASSDHDNFPSPVPMIHRTINGSTSTVSTNLASIFTRKNLSSTSLATFLSGGSALDKLIPASPAGVEEHMTMATLRVSLQEALEGAARDGQKDELRKYNESLVWDPDNFVELDLLSKQRLLVHAGLLFSRSDHQPGHHNWSTVHVLLFDHYRACAPLRVCALYLNSGQLLSPSPSGLTGIADTMLHGDQYP